MTIGLDIGGYKINSVLLDKNKIVKKYRVLTKSRTNKKIILEQIFSCIENLIKGINKKEIKSIGIGVPRPYNVTGLRNIFLGKIVQEKFKIKTKIENDANCFGLAEVLLGAGKNKKIIAGLTLGTGVGGFLIKNKKPACRPASQRGERGRIFRGKSPRATEFGHLAIINNGRKCSCGRKGCLETYISARGITKTAQELGLEGPTPKSITQLAKRGNKKAIKVYKITGNYLGKGLKNIVKKFKPEIIVIGGGISGAEEFILNPARKIIKNIKIVRAKLGEDAGAIGAAIL